MQNMLSRALRKFTNGPLNQLIVNLGGEHGEEWETEFKKFLRKEICWNNQKSTSQLLQFVTSVTVPEVKQFKAADHFKHGEVVEGVKCYPWDNFQKHFGSKMEEDVEGCDIHIHSLLTSARDLHIRAEIGEEREETKLAHLWYLLTLQPNGKKGALITNSYANVFYIRDTENVLWAVIARWRGGEWYLSASSVGDPDRWDGGDRVCSR